MLNKYIDFAIQNSATDIHLCGGKPPSFRIRGEIFRPNFPSCNTTEIELISKSNFPIVSSHNLRFTTFTADGRLAIAIRLLHKTPPSTADLDLPAALVSMSGNPSGLIIICGKTGAGKSTSMASLLSHINATSSRVIVTLEDPIEYKLNDCKSVIYQREVGVDVESIAQGINSALRQDPDVIAIGEMRSNESIEMTLRAAETGHLVLSTLHAASAVGAISRITEVFTGDKQNFIRALLAESLLGILYQRMRHDNEGSKANFELMVVTPAIRNLIRENKIHMIENVIRTSSSIGMRSL